MAAISTGEQFFVNNLQFIVFHKDSYTNIQISAKPGSNPGPCGQKDKILLVIVLSVYSLIKPFTLAPLMQIFLQNLI